MQYWHQRDTISTKYQKFYDLKDRGCLFQLNLLSTTGYYGGESIKKCDEF